MNALHVRKIVTISMFATAALLSGMILTAGLAAQQQPEARVVSSSGRVEMRESAAGAWSAVEKGMRLPLGATISTGFGSTAELEIGPATLEVRQLSRLTLEELIEREGLVESDLFLQVGRVRANVRTTEGRQSEFRMRSPVATAAVRGTSFEFDGVNLQVQTGSVRLANQFGESVSVGGGEGSSSTGEEPPAPPAAQREAAATVQVFVSPPGEAPRTEGTRTSSTPSNGGDAIGDPEPTTGEVTVEWEVIP